MAYNCGPRERSRCSDWPRAGRCMDRIPLGATLSSPVQTGPGAYPTSFTIGAVSFLGVKRPGRGADYPPPSCVEVKESLEVYLYSPSGPPWPVLGWTFFFYFHGHNCSLKQFYYYILNMKALYTVSFVSLVAWTHRVLNFCTEQCAWRFPRFLPGTWVQLVGYLQRKHNVGEICMWCNNVTLALLGNNDTFACFC